MKFDVSGKRVVITGAMIPADGGHLINSL